VAGEVGVAVHEGPPQHQSRQIASNAARLSNHGHTLVGMTPGLFSQSHYRGRSTFVGLPWCLAA
jgi:hypothetical protein